MALKKAMIIVERSSSEEVIEVLFNPNEYKLDGGNQYGWQTIPGLQSPIAQYISGEATNLSMELFFDSYEKESDVRKHTHKVTSLLDVDKDLHAPPLCRFVWGSLDFKGVVEKISQTFTMFLDTGVPVRATLQVTFRSMQTMKEQYQNIPRQSADRTKERILTEGDELWLIAHQEYDDPSLWRDIASVNRMKNPRDIEVGKRIVIPRLE